MLNSSSSIKQDLDDITGEHNETSTIQVDNKVTTANTDRTTDEIQIHLEETSLSSTPQQHDSDVIPNTTITDDDNKKSSQEQPTMVSTDNKENSSKQTVQSLTCHDNDFENTDDQRSQEHQQTLDQEYLVKTIAWTDPKTKTERPVRIITQNKNGPCPLVSICNVLFIRGDISVRPFERETVTFEYLMECLGDYLLNHAPSDEKTVESSTIQEPLSSSPIDESHEIPMKSTSSRQSTMEYVLTYRHNLESALTILPRLQAGLDINVQFSSIYDFEATAELALFDLFDVNLVHGWIPDPQDEETYRVVHECKSYNGLVECVVRGNEVNLETSSLLDNVEQRKKKDQAETRIHDGLVASTYLQDTATQLTYYGIELLMDTLPQNTLCVLFRNNHFSTLYKHPITNRLYTLVTDSGLVSESQVIWETLGDVDQGTSEFVNSQFIQPLSTRPSSSARQEQENRETADLDYAIALSLQQHQQDNINRTSPSVSSTNTHVSHSISSKKKHCIIS
ncbi:uncharacterized protein BX664DRAFT_318881 [Halteromyces radiatus]|uniref:uncharacterized protein n=1 Tax=Halteromyces radiatus TaxID=101107 RepID=UPI0022203D95|nr:uncharacterized protein BX664DRAFT_318881 [Halteromyces radiatus]KAI8098506.1 hypothetical protein BX664DRAFT_318881 [Halteromyces radiatus]